MNTKHKTFFIIATLIFSLLAQTVFSAKLIVDAGDDIVGGASDDIASGSSVFVFRGSKKQPHVRNAFRKKSYQRTTGDRTLARSKRIKQNGEAMAINNSAVPKNNSKTGKARARTKTARVPPKEKLADTLARDGQKFLDQKNYEQAERTFKLARVQNRDHEAAKKGLVQLYTMRGDELFEKADYQQAAAFYEQALGLDATVATTFADMGDAYDALNQSDKAIFAYENALRLDSSLESSLVPTLAVLYYEAQNLPQAEKYASRAINLNPGEADLQNTYGLILYKQKRNAEALAAFQAAVQQLPSFAEAHYNMGEVFDALGNDADAVAAYREAIRLDPKLPEPYYGLGVAFYNREQYPEAAQNYEKAIELKPDFVEARKNLADAYRQMEKYDQATTVYATIVPYEPNNSELFNKYGYCAGKAKDWNKSAEVLEKAAALDNGGTADDYTNIAWAYNNGGRDAAKAKDEPRAKESFAKGREAGQKAVEKDPQSASAKFNLGDALMQTGENAAAVEVLRAAVGLRSDWAEAYNNLGLALDAHNDLNGAAAELRNAIRFKNNFVSAHANLAIVELKRGNKKEAQKEMEIVKSLNPNFSAQLSSYVNTYLSPAVLKQRAKQKIKEKTVDKVRSKIPF